MKTLFVAFAGLVVFAVVPASAQDSDEPEIVVTADRLRELTLEFSTEIGAAPVAENQLARWNDNICVGAVGFVPDTAQVLVDRISARAQAVGLDAGRPGCRANVTVIYAPDSDALSREIVDRRRELLGYYADEGRVTAGREALEEFASMPRAVRWWHVARTTSGDGRALGGPATRAGDDRPVGDNGVQSTTDVAAGSMGAGDFQGLEGVRSNGSRLRSQRNTRQDISYVLIVVDARRVAEVQPTAWMDYVAMVALAQIDPNAEVRDFPTILNLFSAPQDAPPALTDWDVAYLTGLYSAIRTATSARVQQGEIAQTMAAELSSNKVDD